MLIRARLTTGTPTRDQEAQNRTRLFLRIAAGLEDPSAADALR